MQHIVFIFTGDCLALRQLKENPGALDAYKKMGRCFESSPPASAEAGGVGAAAAAAAAAWEATCDPMGEVSSDDKEAARQVSAEV